MSAEDPTGETLESTKYAVERVLGRGGMGTVFQARHIKLGHQVAIKILAEGLRRHAELVTRFEREARAASALSSPHAVRVFDIDTTDDGVPFIVMELLAGRDLGQILASSGPQPIGMAVRWIIDACDAIGEAHRLGIVHRDVKPANLLLCDVSGGIKVLDFGIAKHVASKDAAITANVAPLGTPQYMSPEQVRCSRDVDTRTDIWSLGVTLYELVTGRPPYNHDVAQACIAAVIIDPVPDPRKFRRDLPEELAAVLLRALEKDVDDRYQSVDEFVEALLPFVERASGTDLGSLSLATSIRSPKRGDDRLGPVSVKPRRVAFGWVGAAVIGLATLTSTTRFVDEGGSRRLAASAPPQSLPSEVVSLPSAIPLAAEPEPSAQAESAQSKDAALPAKPVLHDPSTTASAKRGGAANPRPAPKALAPVRAPDRARGHALATDRAAHGGMSNPGF